MDVTTFYSYKGGLGRSLLLAWTARLLAAKGRRVVAVDLDIEAPGLAFKLGFQAEADLGPGLVGLIRDFQRGAKPPESLWAWLRPVPGKSNLWLLPAGPGPTPGYWGDLASISWQDLFFGPEPQGARFFAWLRGRLAADVNPDHVLVDARTGVTELGGAALALLADRVVALVGTSMEGLTGTREVLRALVHAPRAAERPAPRVVVVLSRLPATMPAPATQGFRRNIRDFLNEEADPLPATLEVELPLVVRSEPDLEVDERRALEEENLRLHDDYRAFIDWFEGGPVPEDAPGPAPADDGGVAALRASIELHRALANRDPARYMPEFARALAQLGGVLAVTGKSEEAGEVFLQALAIRERLAKAEPDRADYQRDLSASYINVGDLYRALGQDEKAREAFLQALAIVERLAKAEPDRADYQRDLSVSYNRVGDLYRSLGQGEKAREAFLQALAIVERLAKAEPDRADYQRDRSISYNRLGDLHLRFGEGEKAREFFLQDLAIAERLAKAEPDRADYQRDLSVSYERIGDIYLALGQGEKAREAFLQALAIAERLAKAEPDRADYQVDLAISLVKVATATGADGIPHLQRALALLRELDAQGRLAPADQPKIADLETMLGKLTSASLS